MKRKITLKPILISATILIVPSLLASQPDSEGWTRFRGPNGAGVSDASNLPTNFGPEQNVMWKTALPPGHSSPVLAGDRIFLTAFEENKLFTICLDRATGKILWRKESPRDREEKLDSRNNPASPSPVTDGQSVFVFFPDFGLLAYDFKGNERWRLPLGPYHNIYGMGASPVVADGKVLLVCDQNLNSYLIAVDKNDGTVKWKVDRPEAKSGHSTPIFYRTTENELQAIVAGSFLLTAYSVDSGEKAWWVRGLSFEMKSTPVMMDDMVFINGYASPMNQPGKQIPVPAYEEACSKFDANGDGRFVLDELTDRYARNWFSFVDLDSDSTLNADEWNYYQAAMASLNGMLAIRLGGEGDMTEQNLVWQYHRSVPQLPSPLLYKGFLYMINDGGIATSFNPRTGEVIKQGRLKGAVDQFYASPVAADDKIFFVSRSGKVAVVKPDGQLEVAALNKLGEDCYATPALAGNRIYLRTTSTLYCFGLTSKYERQNN